MAAATPVPTRSRPKAVALHVEGPCAGGAQAVAVGLLLAGMGVAAANIDPRGLAGPRGNTLGPPCDELGAVLKMTARRQLRHDDQ